GLELPTGIAVVSYEWQACWVLLLSWLVFSANLPEIKDITMPEFLQKRFQSQWVRTYLTVVALFSYVFTKFSVDIYAGSLFLYEAVGWNIYISAACVLAITAVYTVLGGLTAVIFTDVLQCIIMVLGAIDAGNFKLLRSRRLQWPVGKIWRCIGYSLRPGNGNNGA
ncbi:Sodium/glucose cotransporter 4, partial [Desmophyllum pertusum]